jgi:hypothetical protein
VELRGRPSRRSADRVLGETAASGWDNRQLVDAVLSWSCVPAPVGYRYYDNRASRHDDVTTRDGGQSRVRGNARPHQHCNNRDLPHPWRRSTSYHYYRLRHPELVDDQDDNSNSNNLGFHNDVASYKHVVSYNDHGSDHGSDNDHGSDHGSDNDHGSDHGDNDNDHSSDNDHGGGSDNDHGGGSDNDHGGGSDNDHGGGSDSDHGSDNDHGSPFHVWWVSVNRGRQVRRGRELPGLHGRSGAGSVPHQSLDLRCACYRQPELHGRAVRGPARLWHYAPVASFVHLQSGIEH